MQTLRYADPQTVAHYPFDIPTAADWRPVDGGFRVTIPLPDLEKDWIIAPSLSVLDDQTAQYRFTLRASNTDYPLAPVPPGPDTRHDNVSDRHVRTAIDCFHTLTPVRDVTLTVTMSAAQAPERYLLTISARPTEIQSLVAESLPGIRTATPPARSQMLENPRHAGRICSPMSTAMVLAMHKGRIDYHEIIAACFDPVTRMYGMWPLAIRAASHLGCIGAVELLSGWAPVVSSLERNLPVVASIRYGADQLPGAPQRSTGGHLVVVHGVTEKGADGAQDVLVNDPAAPHHGSVSRRYPLEAFTRAWFRYRGAAYILTP